VTRGRAGPGIGALGVALAVAGLVGTASALGPDPAEQARHLIVMLTARYGDDEVVGAGILVGTGPDRLYVATANHVVRSGGRVPADIHVQFRSLPGERFPARLGEHRDDALDLTVLVVPDVRRHNIPVEQIPFDRLGAPETLQKGAGVFPLGYARGRAWYSPVRPDTMTGPPAGDRLVFESSFIARGHSGGGLFTEGWELVGMIEADEPPEGRALSITRILARLQEWGYPVSLRPAAPAGDVAAGQVPRAPAPEAPARQVPPSEPRPAPEVAPEADVDLTGRWVEAAAQRSVDDLPTERSGEYLDLERLSASEYAYTMYDRNRLVLRGRARLAGGVLTIRERVPGGLDDLTIELVVAGDRLLATMFVGGVREDQTVLVRVP
jgi:hypothetical protein